MRILIATICILSCAVVFAQDTSFIKLSQTEVTLEFLKENNYFVFTSQVEEVRSSNEGVNVDNPLANAKVYKFNIADYISYQPHYDSSFLNRDIYFTIDCRSKNENNLILDHNNNGSFKDDSVINIIQNDPIRIDINIYLDSTNSSIDIPFSLELYNQDGDVSIYSLLAYNYLIPGKINSSKYPIYLGLWYSHFVRDSKNSENGKQKYLLGEPFEYDENYAIIDQINIINKTARHITLKENAKPIGYKVGYYVEIDKLNSIIKNSSYIENNKSLVRWNTLLLYYWGKWCGPCIKKFPRTRKLAKFIDKFPNSNMLGIPLVKNNENAIDVLIFADQNDLNFQQHPEYINFGENISLIKQLKIFAYPSYVLLDYEGKILYRSTGMNDKKLKDLQRLIEENN